jgi:Mrp family chromosome partitioning ATPase
VENELANVRRQIGGATDPQQSADLAVTEQELLARSQVLIDAIETTRLDLVTSVQLTNELDDADSLARIINHAAVPAAPSGPDVSRNLMLALIAGLVLGVGAAISRDLFDRKARDGVALGRELDVPLLGQIRHRDGPPGGAVGTDDGIQDGTHDGTDRSTGAATDAYRGVSNSILLESAETPQALAMTSERPMPGRTIAAVELAQLEASRGLDVLIVDADTADASVAARLGLPRPAGQLGDSTTPPVASPGPTDAQPGTVAGTVRTASPGLDHAEVGQDRLEEDLRSGAFRALLKDIRQEYDLVVFVIPAVLGGGDPRPAAGVVDATIVTYDPSVSRTTEVRRAVEALREARVNVVGLLAMQATASATERLRSGVRARVGAGRRRGRVHPRPV